MGRFSTLFLRALGRRPVKAARKSRTIRSTDELSPGDIIHVVWGEQTYQTEILLIGNTLIGPVDQQEAYIATSDGFTYTCAYLDQLLAEERLSITVLVWGSRRGLDGYGAPVAAALSPTITCAADLRVGDAVAVTRPRLGTFHAVIAQVDNDGWITTTDGDEYSAAGLNAALRAGRVQIKLLSTAEVRALKGYV